MNDKFSECNTPFTKCWCEAVPGRQNNPHCKSLIPSVAIDNPIFIIVMMFLGILVFLKCKPNSLSAAYGFNVCLEYVKNISHKALN